MLKSLSIKFSNNLKTDYFLNFFHFLTQDFFYSMLKYYAKNIKLKHIKRVMILMIKIVFILFYKSQYPVQ